MRRRCVGNILVEKRWERSSTHTQQRINETMHTHKHRGGKEVSLTIFTSLSRRGNELFHTMPSLPMRRGKEVWERDEAK